VVSIAVIVLAKEPRVGHSKTRLCPPCTHPEAARLARAALSDTLAAVDRSGAHRKVLVLEGEPRGLIPDDYELIRQRPGGLDERIAGAFEDFGGPALLIGMDTPQVGPELLRVSCSVLERPDVDAVLGPTDDGGYWAVGLKQSTRDAFMGVPMSTPTTLAAQRARFDELGIRCAELPRLRDVDYFDDACAVAQLIPASDFAYSLGRILARMRQRIA
jgi:rSAM/selenodomain-associated transferase 1